RKWKCNIVKGLRFRDCAFDYRSRSAVFERVLAVLRCLSSCCTPRACRVFAATRLARSGAQRKSRRLWKGGMPDCAQPPANGVFAKEARSSQSPTTLASPDALRPAPSQLKTALRTRAIFQHIPHFRGIRFELRAPLLNRRNPFHERVRH